MIKTSFCHNESLTAYPVKTAHPFNFNLLLRFKAQDSLCVTKIKFGIVTLNPSNAEATYAILYWPN